MEAGMSIDFDEAGDVVSLHDLESVLAGVLAHPAVKGFCAIGLWGCTQLGLPVDLAIVMGVLFAADFVFGCAFAMSRGKFTCRKFMRGMAKIPVYTLLLVIAWLAQYMCQNLLHTDLPVPLWTAAYLAMHDALSIIGKADAMGLPVPPLIKSAMRRINHAAETCVESALDKVDPPKDDGAFKKF